MDDSAIVELFWKRDEQAIAATTEKYNVYCLSIAMNILGNIEDAEECVNDAYLNTWNSIPPNKPKMLSTYLGKIVRICHSICIRKTELRSAQMEASR